MGRPIPAALGRALDGVLVAPALNELFQGLLGSKARIRGVTGEIVKRCTIRYLVELEGGQSSSLRLVGKVYATRAEGEDAFQALSWLSAQGFSTRAPESIAVPRPLAYVSHLALLLMEEVGGQSLKRFLNKGEGGHRDLRRFADGLVKLHRFPAVYGAPFHLDQHLEQRCAGLCGPLAHAFPRLSIPIARILATARRAEADGRLATSTLAHGDYHPGQVHLDGKRLWLVDLDLLHHGDPAYDVAMVVLTMKRMGVRLASEGRFRVLLEAFLVSYFARMDLAIAERVPLHAALIFLQRACKRFRYQNDPAWENDIHLQIRRGEECLDWLAGRRAPHDVAEALELCMGCPTAE
jgi:tRNA A-37 threonylcarbamoyl transferase component Bud32